MADFTDRINLIIDVTADKAGKGFKDFKSSVSEAEGGFGKLKAGADSALNTINANGAAVATAVAGTAIAIAKTTIGAFTELANAAQSFSAASGASLEDSSRWIETADDLGVSAEAVSGAMARLNREAASGDLAKFGITTGDVNERLLQTLETIAAIPDPAARAKAQFELLGKQGAALAPLLANVDSLRDRLAEVEKAKIIDAEKAAQAREFQDNIDRLNDLLDDLKNTLGGGLVEGFNDLFQALDQITSVIPGIDGLSDAIGTVSDIATGPLRNVADGIATITDSSSSLTDRARGLGQTITGAIPGPLGSWASGLFDVTSEQEKVEDATKQAALAAEEQARAAQEAADALDALLTSTLAQFNAQLGLEDAADKTATSFDKYRTNVDTATQSNWGNKEANDAVRGSMNDAEGAALKQAAAAAKLAEDNATLNGTQWGAAESAQVQAGVLRTLAGQLGPNDPLRANLLAYADQLEKIPPHVDTTVNAHTDDAMAKLNAVTEAIKGFNGKNFFATLNLISKGAAGVPAGASTSAAATSAPALLGASALPALPAAAPRASAAPTTVINVSVSAAPLTHPAEVGRQVANYLDAFYRRNSSRLRAVP